MGYGLAKMVLLAVPLEHVLQMSTGALPIAHNGWASFVGMLAFTCQLYLVHSGLVDLWAGAQKLRGRELQEGKRDPLWAGGFTDLWHRWYGSLGISLPSRTRAFAGLVLLAVTVLIWRGPSSGMLVWLGLHAALLMGEQARGGHSWLGSRLPLPVRAVLTVLVFFLGNVFLYSNGIADGWAILSKIFSPPANTLYSVFLDRRLTAPWFAWALWLGLITTVGAPGLVWLLALPIRTWRVCGVVLGLFSLWVVLGELRFIPGSNVLHHYTQVFKVAVLGEGSSSVFVGEEGWLYQQRELDHLTQSRSEDSMSSRMAPVIAQLKAQGITTIILPVPDKLALYPEKVLPAEYKLPIFPSGYVSRLEQLRIAGADVFDPTSLLWKNRKKMPAYFQQDSHWTPEAMKEVAVQLSFHIRKSHPGVFKDATPMINATILEREDAGDLASELDPWDPESLWGTEAVQLVSIQGMEVQREADFLVTGGSLTRVFDDPNLSFGNAEDRWQGAGFLTQLGALLGRSVDYFSDEDTAALISRAQGKKWLLWVVRAGEL